MITLIITMILLELFEAWWQRAGTLRGTLANGYSYYRQSIFVYFAMHPAYYYTLFVVLITDMLNGWLVAILTLKTFDLFFKISLMRELYERDGFNPAMEALLDAPLSPWLFLTGLGIYPFLLYYAIS